MQKHIQDVIRFKQFTIVAPTNAMFESMNKSYFDTLISGRKERGKFLMDHIFVGVVGNNDDTTNDNKKGL